jgi:cytochrome bd ubiquinol oxidase subunit II
LLHNLARCNHADTIGGSGTIWQAASPENSQVFMLFGVAVLVSLILGYTAWAYWVFRGKVKPESGYH